MGECILYSPPPQNIYAWSESINLCTFINFIFINYSIWLFSTFSSLAESIHDCIIYQNNTSPGLNGRAKKEKNPIS